MSQQEYKIMVLMANRSQGQTNPALSVKALLPKEQDKFYNEFKRSVHMFKERSKQAITNRGMAAANMQQQQTGMMTQQPQTQPQGMMSQQQAATAGQMGGHQMVPQQQPQTVGGGVVGGNQLQQQRMNNTTAGVVQQQQQNQQQGGMTGAGSLQAQHRPLNPASAAANMVSVCAVQRCTPLYTDVQCCTLLYTIHLL